jgi:hypothetical protein
VIHAMKEGRKIVLRYRRYQSREAKTFCCRHIASSCSGNVGICWGASRTAVLPCFPSTGWRTS